jgi:hypothetical protein
MGVTRPTPRASSGFCLIYGRLVFVCLNNDKMELLILSLVLNVDDLLYNGFLITILICQIKNIRLFIHLR